MTKDEYWKRMAKRTLKELKRVTRDAELVHEGHREFVQKYDAAIVALGRRLSECEAAVANLIRERDVVQLTVRGDGRGTALPPLEQYAPGKARNTEPVRIPEPGDPFFTRAGYPAGASPVDLDEALLHLPDGPAPGAISHDDIEEARLKAEVVRAHMEKEAREAELAELSYYDDKGRPWKEAYAEMQANYERQLEALTRRLEALGVL